MMQVKYRKPKWTKRIIIFILVAACAVFATSAIVMLLWNAVLPSLLSTKPISYWQAVGLLILCKILFGSFRPGGRRPPFGPPSKVRENWMSMSEEEKAKFKDEWKKRRGSSSDVDPK